MAIAIVLPQTIISRAREEITIGQYLEKRIADLGDRPFNFNILNTLVCCIEPECLFCLEKPLLPKFSKCDRFIARGLGIATALMISKST